MRNVVVLGSTGSVGTSALDVIRTFPENFRVTALTAHSSAETLVAQALEFRPSRVGVADPAARAEVAKRLVPEGIEVLDAEHDAESIAGAPETDVVLAAIVGVAGLLPALCALRAGKTLAVANKEPLVAAGGILMRTARENDAAVLPVDSEHSAIFQSLRAGRTSEVRQILLTASGGPFRTRDLGTFAGISVEEALRHPTWEMGRKISIDSATMMNKALEIVEAVALFGVPEERIRVVVHPQSIVHSMVEFRDGSIVGQMGAPDMRLPILFALAWPDRLEYEPLTFRISDFAELTFEDPDPDRYPALALGRRAARDDGVAGAVMNAANEAAVAAFLEGVIPFTEIVRLTAHAMDAHDPVPEPTLADILGADRFGRLEVEQCLKA